jgi:hypothetical protein
MAWFQFQQDCGAQFGFPATIWSVFSSSSSKIVDLSSGHPENHALVSILVPAGFWTLGAVTQRPDRKPASRILDLRSSSIKSSYPETRILHLGPITIRNPAGNQPARFGILGAPLTEKWDCERASRIAILGSGYPETAQDTTQYLNCLLSVHLLDQHPTTPLELTKLHTRKHVHKSTCKDFGPWVQPLKNWSKWTGQYW